MKNKYFRGSPIAAAAVSLLLFTGPLHAAGLKTLPAKVPEVIAGLHLQSIGRLPQTNRLHLAIGLPLHHQKALSTLLGQLYDPASPQYHHFLTPEQFTEMFGPSAQDYHNAMAFAKASGLDVTGAHSSRMVLDVEGDVAHIEKAFHVTLQTYQHPTENRTFFAPDVAPSVATNIPILNVAGLNNFILPHPANLKMDSLNPTNASPGTGSGPAGLYMGYDFRHAYLPGISLDGSGQKIGLLQFDSGFYQSDITDYEIEAGLPTNISVVPILLNGYNGGPGMANGEVSLDIEMSISMAPGNAGVYVFEGDQPDDLLDAMASSNEIKQLSASWGYGIDATSDNLYQKMAAQGQSFFNASGDGDAWVGPIPFGSVEDPNITIVGGTTLTMSGNGASYSSEKVWNWGFAGGYGWNPDGYVGSSGGISTDVPIPAWQQGIDMSASGGSTTFRNVPDVSLTADNIYVIFDDGQQGGFGGTSCASPLWAGFMALINQQAMAIGHSPLGFINPAVYNIAKGADYATVFHDTTIGNNVWPGSSGKFFAVPGYDLCTGLGTPNGPNFIDALLGKRTGILQTSVTPPAGSALLQGTTQPIAVAVNDVYGVTNAMVTATITNNLGATVATLTFTNSPGQSVYNATLSVPAAANPLTMVVAATATNEIGNTNVVNYSVIAQPPNDNFVNATKVPAAGASYLANNTLATIEINEPAHDGDQYDAGSLWWSWTPTVNTNVFINTDGSRVDNVLAVYNGSALASLQSVAATNSSLFSYKPAQLSFSALAGTTYYIAVASAGSNSLGTVRLQVAPGGRPDTNVPAVFVSYPQSGLTVSEKVIAITGTATDSGANASGVSQVFVTVDGARTTTVGTTNWTVLAALQPGLNFVKVNAVDEAGNISPTTTVQVNYLVPPPANDYFVNAITLVGNSGIVFGTNTVATKEVGEPDPAGNPGGKSLWWSFTPPADGLLTLNTSNSTFDTIMGLYTGTNVASLTTVVDNDDAYSGAAGGFSYISQAVKSNQTYHILVDGFDGASGAISLTYSFTTQAVYQVSANTSGGGTVELSSTNRFGGVATLPSTSGYFAQGTTVVLTALPDHNDQFDSWTNGVVSRNNPVFAVVNGNLQVTADFIARQFTDGFESGDLSHLTWTTAGDAPWFVQTNVADIGQYAARSGIITNSQSSSLILTTNFVAGNGSFDFKVSSEPGYDLLSFSVDGAVQAKWSGEIGWANYSFPLTSGTHTLEWTYTKDPTISTGLDGGFIDDVNLPIGVLPPQLQLQLQSGGGLVMNLTEQSSQQYIIQSSTDLVHWQNILTNTAVGASTNIALPFSLTNRTQFYRALAP